MTTSGRCQSGLSLAKLIGLAAGGDRGAFMEFYDRTCSTVFTRVLARLSGDWEAAKQVTEQIFLRAWASVPEMAASELSVLEWLLDLESEVLAAARDVGADG